MLRHEHRCIRANGKTNVTRRFDCPSVLHPRHPLRTTNITCRHCCCKSVPCRRYLLRYVFTSNIQGLSTGFEISAISANLDEWITVPLRAIRNEFASKEVRHLQQRIADEIYKMPLPRGVCSKKHFLLFCIARER
jgi:hypothetical protein